MALIVWILIAFCTVSILSLVETRLLMCLLRSFEFWLLHVVNIVSLVAYFFMSVVTNASAAIDTSAILFVSNILLSPFHYTLLAFVRSFAFRSAAK
jgi:hypothetical protein